MPTLKFGAEVRPNRKKIYQKVFDKACDEMGITNLPGTVNFAELNLKGYAEGVLLEMYEGYYLLAVHVGNNLWSTTYTLSHEIVHLKQYLRKEIQHIPGEGLKWGGIVYPKEVTQTDDFEKHKNLPWEVEAYAKQDALHIKVISSLGLWQFIRVIIGYFR